MTTDQERESLRSRAATIALHAGAAVALYSVINAIPQVEGAKGAGGAFSYLGVSRWQDHLPFVLWGFSLPFAGALSFMASALRNTAIAGWLAVGAPLGFMVACVVMGLSLDFPTVVPGLFGIGGVLIAASVVITLALRGAEERLHSPRAWLLRGLGYLNFASATWFTCGLLSTPGAVLFPALEHDQATITDLAHKIMILWVSGWVLTALGVAIGRPREPRDR